MCDGEAYGTGLEGQNLGRVLKNIERCQGYGSNSYSPCRFRNRIKIEGEPYLACIIPGYIVRLLLPYAACARSKAFGWHHLLGVLLDQALGVLDVLGLGLARRRALVNPLLPRIAFRLALLYLLALFTSLSHLESRVSSLIHIFPTAINCIRERRKEERTVISNMPGLGCALMSSPFAILARA